MDVTIIGTDNMARAIGSRVHAGVHDLTVIGKDAERAEEKGTSSIAVCFSPGSASAIASLVLLVVVALATKSLRRARRSSRSMPSGRTSSTLRRFVVRVPVLSSTSVSMRSRRPV